MSEITEAEALEAFIAEWRRDLSLISDRLNREAEERDWCNEYDQILEEINSIIAMPIVGRGGVVTRTYEVTGRGVAGVTVVIELDMPVYFSQHAEHERASILRREATSHVSRLFYKYDDERRYESLEIHSARPIEINFSSR